MQWLPVLHYGTAKWKLPLADPAAALLAEAFLTEEPQERCRRIEQSLGNNPTLALWTISNPESLQATPSTMPTLAKWLAINGPRIFHGEAQTSLNESTDTINGPSAAKLAAESLTRAAGQPVDRYLFCLISNAQHWLSASGTVVSWSQIKEGKTCIPLWFAKGLSGLSAPWKTQTPDDKLLEEQISYWSTPVPGVGQNLKSLLAKLHRLQQLEDNFSETLEIEKLLSLKQFAYGAGHEINNPLTNISTRAQTLLGGEQDPERRRKLATINSQAFRAHEMIADLMLFAQPPQINRQNTDLVQTVQRLSARFAEMATTQQVQFRSVTTADSVVVMADPDQLQIALEAICLNAFDAVAQDGTIEVTLLGTDELPQHPGFVAVQIRDTGPGIPIEVQRHLFDPFFSGREAGRGIGFGLSKCWRIVTDHGGNIVVDSQLESGATFTVLLPNTRNAKTQATNHTEMAKTTTSKHMQT